MSTVRLGFIGAGGYGRTQLDGFLPLQAQGFVQITALADSSPAILMTLNELPELRSAKCFTDYRDLLAFEQLDAVIITVPIPLHEEVTLAALERDLVILLEKPPVPLLSQLERLIEADVRGRVMVGFQHIYSKIIRGLKRELIGGRIGKIQSLSAYGLWPRDTAYYERSVWAGQLAWKGNPVLDGPCTNGFAHFINLLLYLAGAREESFALPSQVTGEAYRARPGLPTYDTGCFTGVLENDVRAFFGFSHACETLSPVEVRIEGEEGRVRLFHDCEALQFGDEPAVRGDCGREEMRRAFVAFATGDASQNQTSLRSM
jgi:predicted dehydrogenase